MPSAPLPFTGQKRFFIKPVVHFLQKHMTNGGAGFCIVDVFGGSGLIAHQLKSAFPKARVIYNDFDHYCTRLAHIDDTNRLRRAIAQIIGTNHKKQPLSGHEKRQVVDVINHFDGYKDLKTLAAWLLFSAKQVTSFEDFFKETFYYRLAKKDYAAASDYLQGLEVVHEDFRPLMQAYAPDPKAVFVLDPPYIFTTRRAYASFALVDFLQLMDLTRPPYVFFSSEKSEILGYMRYLQMNNAPAFARLGGFEQINQKASCAANKHYTDHLLAKWK